MVMRPRIPVSSSSLALITEGALRRCMPICTICLVLRTACDHLPALLNGERHGLFEVHVLLGVEGRLEHGKVLVIGRGDDDGVEAGLAEQLVVIDVSLGLRRALFSASWVLRS